jgi:hypothetical protein
MLDQHGEFYPYGVAIDASGETHLTAGHPGEERPPSQSVLDILVAQFAAGWSRGGASKPTARPGRAGHTGDLWPDSWRVNPASQVDLSALDGRTCGHNTSSEQWTALGNMAGRVS